mmetsp:Transcript_2227/g.9654  ORF Transcript_2227/g.9654 Transcript_2227/m.9654 type:complete len:123 (+) Transcript_2227:1338-1706(+)
MQATKGLRNFLFGPWAAATTAKERISEAFSPNRVAGEVPSGATPALTAFLASPPKIGLLKIFAAAFYYVKASHRGLAPMQLEAQVQVETAPEGPPIGLCLGANRRGPPQLGMPNLWSRDTRS